MPYRNHNEDLNCFGALNSSHNQSTVVNNVETVDFDWSRFRSPQSDDYKSPEPLKNNEYGEQFGGF
jgi:hypothetical protein